MTDCLFCKIIDGSMPSLKIFESKNVIGVLSIKPASKGHVLVIPKKHEAYLHALSNDILSEVMTAIKNITTIISQAFKPTGFNIMNNIGAGAGQKVPHVSFDIIPRYEGDGIKIEIPQGEINEKELINVQKELIKVSRENTIKTLKAIKEGKINASDEVKAEAEKLLAKLEEEKNPLGTVNKQYSKKLEDLMND